MSQESGKGWDIDISDRKTQLLVRMMATPNSQSVSALVVLALLFFLFLVSGNYVGLW